MKFYLAPMEGITGYIYRNAYHQIFLPMEKYFSPFLAPNQSRSLKTRELQDILPENNPGIPLVPQILTNQWEDFVWATEKLRELGYREVNLNLGCPSGTVTAKGRGAGFLANPEGLDRFLDNIFSRSTAEISIKTRLGIKDPAEFERLMEIYSQYPLKELIIHPRVREDYYKNLPNLAAFARGAVSSSCPVCYNGNIFTQKDFWEIETRFPQISAVMLGRGILKNPMLLEEIAGENRREGSAGRTSEEKCRLRRFHDKIYTGYQRIMSGERNTLFKMKELWTYLGSAFEGGERYKKKIKKAERLKDYENAVGALFEECTLIGKN